MEQPLWLVENPQYQYKNFKDFIEYTKWDVLSLHPSNSHKAKDKNLYTLSGDLVDIDKIKEKYSVIIKTGSNKLPFDIDLLSVTKYRKAIQIPHSIIGMIVDAYAGIPLSNQKVLYGLFPKAWHNVSFTENRYQKLKTKNKLDNIKETQTHPYLAKVFEPLKNEVEKNTVGLLLSYNGGVGKFCKLAEQGLKIRDSKLDVLYIKRHPMTDSNAGAVFEPLKKYTKKIVFVEADADKNEFYDRCETIVTGMSSTYVESLLRSKFYKTKQKFYAVNEVNRNGMEDHLFSEQGVDFPDWSKLGYHDNTQYDSLLEITGKDKIFASFFDDIHVLLKRIATKENTNLEKLDEWK